MAMLANAPDPDTGERGVIVNTASGAATQGQVGQAAYSASKAGIVGMTLPVARDLTEHGIRVVTISPGLFETPLVASLPPPVAQGIVDKSILFPHRMGQPQEFGTLMRHMLENPYLNATTISLDAGARMTARWSDGRHSSIFSQTLSNQGLACTSTAYTKGCTLVLIIAGHLTVHASLIEEFYGDVQELSRLARTIDGNLCFCCAVEDQTAGCILVFEKWREKAALDAFIAEPGLAAFFQKWGVRMRNTLRKYDAENERAPQE